MLKTNRTISSYNVSLLFVGLFWLVLSLVMMLIIEPSDFTIRFLSVETLVFLL